MAAVSSPTSARPALGQDRLLLETLKSVDLPADVPRQHAVVGSDLTIIFWSDSDSYILALHKDTWLRVPISPELRPREVHVLSGEPLRIGIVDANSRTYSGVEADGRVVFERSLDLPQEADVRSITRVGDRIAVDVWDQQSSSHRIGLVSPNREVEDIWYALRGAVRTTGTHLSAEGSHVLVTQIDSPFQVIRLDVQSGSLIAFKSPQSRIAELVGKHSFEEGLWVALPAMQLDRGYLQTVTDLRSDLRALVLYSDVGEVTRVSTIEAPIGFIGSNVESRTLWAILDMEPKQLIAYSWRWVSDGNQSTEEYLQ